MPIEQGFPDRPVPGPAKHDPWRLRSTCRRHSSATDAIDVLLYDDWFTIHLTQDIGNHAVDEQPLTSVTVTRWSDTSIQAGNSARGNRLSDETCHRRPLPATASMTVPLALRRGEAFRRARHRQRPRH